MTKLHALTVLYRQVFTYEGRLHSVPVRPVASKSKNISVCGSSQFVNLAAIVKFCHLNSVQFVNIKNGTQLQYQTIKCIVNPQ